MQARFIALILGILAVTFTAAAQNKNATVRERQQIFKTYPFTDPNPIPVMGKIYPYYRYDGFTDKPVNKEWKVVELENDYLKVLILPEIGGKIWTAIEKSTGKAFIYNNEVVKFRDVAMRGPWTSGGIEANYGIIGHTPNVATPVDYVTRENADGSASCFIGALDLLTRTNWQIEIKLAKDKAYFTTTSFWQNTSPIEQPYYTWMNVGLKAKGNLQFIYPGNFYLGHDGEFAEWPENRQNGKDISFYENNNFGGYKSYHVVGQYTDFFGAYWHDENFGMGQYSTHDDKAGKKIWIWGLSQQGMIWEKLLTDTDGQYVEVQSGRLFNQAAERSTFTPFKHRGFAPAQSDSWTEYWFPVKNTKGFVKANPYGALNVIEENNEISLYFSALQTINDKLQVYDGDTLVYEKQLTLKPMQTFKDLMMVKVNAKDLRVTLGSNKLEYLTKPQIEDLSRPLEMPKDFAWDSVYGLWLQGKENLQQRFYVAAHDKLSACLQKDPHYVPALVDMALLAFRNLEYAKALAYAKQALRINTYDAGANYYYGLANVQLGKIVDAKDGFDLAAQSYEYRSAAYTELAKIAFRKKDYAAAAEYLKKDFLANPLNLTAANMRAILSRKEDYSVTLDFGVNTNALSHFENAEQFLRERSPAAKIKFIAAIKNELPQETLLELAAFYAELGLFSDAENIVALASPNAEELLWQAYLQFKQTGKFDAKLFPKAFAAAPAFVFPHRAESLPVLNWAAANTAAWQPKYLLALLYASRDNLAKATELLDACGEQPDFAPFYAARAGLHKKSAPEKSLADLQRAARLDPQQWRYGKLLAERYIENKQVSEALQIASDYAAQFPDNYQLGLLLAKSLLLNSQYQACQDLLAKINILPYEGATDGRRLYRETQLMLALEKMRSKDFARAIQLIEAAKQWPENLGVGKPYQVDIDERLEDWLLADCYAKNNSKEAAQAALQRIVNFKTRGYSLGTLLSALALQKLNRNDEAESLMQSWSQITPNNLTTIWAAQFFRQSKAPLGNYELGTEVFTVLRSWSALP